MMMGDNFKRSEYTINLNFLKDFIHLEEGSKQRLMIKKNELEQKLSPNQLANFIELLTFGCEVYKFMKERLKAFDRKDISSYHTQLTKFLKHIKDIYEKVLFKFKHEEKIYHQYYNFCEWTSFKESSRVCVLLYKHHENNDEMYCLAAKWYLLDRKDYNYSIELLEQRWEKDKSRNIIFNQLIQFEILKNNSNEDKNFLEHMNKRFNDMGDHIDDFQEYSQLLTWMETMNNTIELQKMLIALMIKKFPHDYHMWDFIAMREKKGFHEAEERDQKLSKSKKVNLVINKYEEGMLKLDKNKQSFLWELFLNFLQEVVKEEPNDKEVNVLVLMAYEKADKLGYISEEGFSSWVELTPKEKKITVLNLAITKYPNSISLWKQKFQVVIARKSPEVVKTFYAAISNLRDDSGEIWVMMLRYHIINSKYEDIRDFFNNLANQSESVTYHLRVKYIIWILQNKGIDECRKAYRKFAKQKPYSKELYKAMNTIELSQINKSYDDLKYVYDTGCEQFGRQCIDVWLDYEKFILYIWNISNADKKDKLKTEIYDKALIALGKFECLKIDFKLKYNELSNRYFENVGKNKE